jgi:predicted MFS family arabinose efflux permease
VKTRPLAVLFLINVFNFYDRQALGALLEPLRHEFHLSDAQLGGLSTAFVLVYAVAGLPLGRMADRGSRRRLLAVGMAVWAGLTALGGAAISYAMLLFTRLGVGIGEAVCAPAATSWIGDLVPPRRRASAMAVFMMAIPVGGILSFAVSGPVAQAAGWRMALVIAAVPAVVLIPGVLSLREPSRQAGESGQVSGLQTVLALFSVPSFGWIVVSGALLNFALYTYSTFLPAFLTRVHGLSVAQAGVWAGLGSGAAGILGGLAAAIWGDRKYRSRLAISALASAAAAPVAFAALRAPAAIPAILLILCAYALLQMYYGLVYGAIQDVIEPRLRATAMAVYFLGMYLCGGAFGPLLTGYLSDYFASRAVGTAGIGEAARATGLHHAMYVIPVLAVAVALVLGAASRAAQKAAASSYSLPETA